MSPTPPDEELDELLAFLAKKFHYDFRHYARASLTRRVEQAARSLDVEGPRGVMQELDARPERFGEVLSNLSVTVSEMFRDPPFFRALRHDVVPYLATFPFIRAWVAGCSTGEELYSLAVILRESNLLDRSLVYATDINPLALASAEKGIFPVDRMRGFSESYREAGGPGSLADHYHAASGGAVFDPELRKRMVFSDHSLATDGVFGEMHLILCRNVLIYFDRTLQDRAIGLFKDALAHFGFLGLGAKETLRFSAYESAFTTVSAEQRWYRRC